MIAAGTFREDLFYRLSVVTLDLPPLRERGNDVLLLADRFLEALALKFAKPPKELSCATRRALTEHVWPGNVRELQHALDRAVILSAGRTIELDELPLAVSQPAAAQRVHVAPAAALPLGPDPSLGALPEPERLARALQLAGGKRVRAAELLGISRTTLWRRMREHGLEG